MIQTEFNISFFIELFTVIFELTVIINFFDNTLKRKFQTHFVYITLCLICTAFFSYIDHIKLFENYKVFLLVIIFSIITFAFYKGRIVHKILISVFVIVLLILADLATFSIQNLITIYIIKVDVIYTRILMILISKAIFLILIKLCSKKNIALHNNAKLSTLYYLLVIIFPIISILSFCVLFYSLQFAPQESSIFSGVLTISLGLLFTNIFVFYIFEALLKGVQIQKDAELMEQQHKMQIKHFENMEKAQDNLRSIKHDINNHFFSIQTLLNKGLIDDAKDYILAIDKKMTQTNIFSDCGNVIIDSLLDNKCEIFETEKIIFSKKIIVPKELNIENHDLCIVLSNILDNAVDACKNINIHEQRFIDINIEYKKDFLVIKVRNNFHNKPIEVNGNFITSKNSSEFHGIGLRNVKSTVEKYNGYMDIEVYGEVFKVEIFMCDKKV